MPGGPRRAGRRGQVDGLADGNSLGQLPAGVRRSYPHAAGKEGSGQYSNRHKQNDRDVATLLKTATAGLRDVSASSLGKRGPHEAHPPDEEPTEQASQAREP